MSGAARPARPVGGGTNSGGPLRKLALPLALVALALLFPLINSILDDTVGVDLIFPVIILAIYVVLALGLNIVVGFAGLLDLGFVAFYALGAYVVGWFSSGHFNSISVNILSTSTSDTGIHISFWLLLVVAAAFAALLGVIIGAPTLRLRGDYLAIVTLGFGEIIPRVFQNGDNIAGYNLTNGTVGIKSLDSPGFPFLPDSPEFLGDLQRFSSSTLWPWYYTILALVLITVFVNIRLRDSRLGRAWVAVREDETAAAAMGINLVNAKLSAYALGAVFGGMAGAFYGAFIKNIFPSGFLFSTSILILCMVIVGGMGNIYGVILGAILLQGINFYLLPQLKIWVNAFGVSSNIPSLATLDIPKYNFLLFGLLLVLMMLLRPEGIIPNRQRQEELHADEDDQSVAEPVNA